MNEDVYMCYVFVCVQRLALEKGDPHQFLSAKKPANKDKNRYVNVLPCEYDLVTYTVEIIAQ